MSPPRTIIPLKEDCMNSGQITEKLEKLSTISASSRRTDRVIALLLRSGVDAFESHAAQTLGHSLIRPEVLGQISRVRRVFREMNLKWQFMAVKSLIDATHDDVDTSSKEDCVDDDALDGTVWWDVEQPEWGSNGVFEDPSKTLGD